MFDAPVVARSELGLSTLLTVALPGGLPVSNAAGRFFMARCSSGDAESRAWEPLLRQPLFPVATELAGEAGFWTLLLPPAEPAPVPYPLRAEPAGLEYLLGLQPGDSLNLLGPYGVGFQVEPRTRALLLAADLVRAPLLLPLIDGLLDRGGRVLFLLAAEEGQEADAEPLVRRLPLAVEARVESPAGLSAGLLAHAAWADQICLALPMAGYATAATAVRRGRVRVSRGDAQAMVEAPLPCGVGACLACVVPLANGGFTRACVHGPVMELGAIV